MNESGPQVPSSEPPRRKPSGRAVMRKELNDLRDAEAESVPLSDSQAETEIDYETIKAEIYAITAWFAEQAYQEMKQVVEEHPDEIYRYSRGYSPDRLQGEPVKLVPQRTESSRIWP